MSCPTERLAAAFPSLPGDLEDHVAGCALCADAWSGYRALADLVSALPEPAPSSCFALRRRRRALVAGARLQAAAERGHPGQDRAERGHPGQERAARRRPGQDHAARARLGPDRTPRRLAGLAAAAVLVAGGSLLSSPLGPSREVRVADAPRDVDLPGGSASPSVGEAAAPGPGRAMPPSAAAPLASGSGAPPSGLAPSPWAPVALETWPESIQPLAPLDGDSRPLTLRELRERWAFIGIGPLAGTSAGPRTAPRTAASSDRSGAAGVAAGRIGLPGLPGRPPEPEPDGRGGDSPTGGVGPRDPDLSPGDHDERPAGPDDQATCGDALARRFTECLTELGLDPAHPDDSEETAAIASACWQDAAAAADVCCASSPDASCEETTSRTPENGETCADVLNAENDRCLADSDIEDPNNPVTEADFEIISYCWIDVGNGAFDACCAAEPDATCP